MKRLLGSCAGRVIALLLIGCLFVSAAVAEGAKTFTPMLDDWLRRIEGGEAVDVSMSASLHALLPYDEQTVAAMNRLLAECRVQIGYRRNGQEETTQTRLIIGRLPVIDFMEQSGMHQILAQTSLLPGITFTSASRSPLDILLGSGVEIPDWVGDIPDPNMLAEKIPEALAGLDAFGKEKVSSYRLSSSCTAKKAMIYTVPEESAQQIRDSLMMLADEMNWPEAAALISTLIMDGDAVVTLYQTAEGKNIGLGVKATMGFENIVPRKITFLWTFSTDENVNRHTLSLKSPAVKGTDYLTVAGDLTIQSLQDKNELSFSLDSKSRLNNQTGRTQWTGQLSCLLAEDNQRLEGEIKQTHTDDGETAHTLAIAPSLLTYQVGDEFSVKGSARITWARNKSVMTDVTFSVLAGKTAGVRWAQTKDTVSLDDIGEDGLAQLKQNAQEMAVNAIWEAVLSLPPDCLVLISQNISEDSWERLYKDAFMVGQ